MKYLVLSEFGDLYQTDDLKDDMRESVDDGLIDVIDTENMKALLRKDGLDVWESIEVWAY